MAKISNVRVAQMGQQDQSRPFFEVIVGSRRYCFATDLNGRISLRNRAWLAAMANCSVICKQFEDELDGEGRRVLNLSTDGSLDRTKFVSQTLGTGFAYWPTWSVATGWKELFPTHAITYQLNANGQLNY